MMVGCLFGAAPRELDETDMRRAWERRPRRVHGQHPGEPAREHARAGWGEEIERTMAGDVTGLLARDGAGNWVRL